MSIPRRRNGLGPAAIAALLSLTACMPQGNTSSPTGILGRFYESIRKNDLKTYSECLTGDALVQFDGQAGLDGFRRELETFRRISVANLKLIAVTPNSDGRDALRFYQVDFMTYTDQQKSIWHATEVLCAVTWSGRRESMNCKISRII